MTQFVLLLSLITLNILFICTGGERTLKMCHRLHSILHKKNTESFRLVIILGGTNDMTSLSADHITQNIIKLHSIALNASSSMLSTISSHTHTHAHFPILTIALTIPQLIKWGGKEVDNKRLEVNTGIRKLAATCQPHITLLDFESLFDQNDQNNNKFWSPDLVHFSEKGYDKIGELIYDTIKSTILLYKFNSSRYELSKVCSDILQTPLTY